MKIGIDAEFGVFPIRLMLNRFSLVEAAAQLLSFRKSVSLPSANAKSIYTAAVVLPARR